MSAKQFWEMVGKSLDTSEEKPSEPTNHDTEKVMAESNEIRPDYYGKDDPYEPWKIIRAKKMGFFQGNALKYLMRAGKKEGASKEKDIQKAITYLQDWLRNGEAHE